MITNKSTNFQQINYLLKVYSKGSHLNFSIKNLLASFDYKLFEPLFSLKVLVNPMKNNSPFYIESEEKKAEERLEYIFEKKKISIDNTKFESKFLKIFHFSMEFPKYFKIENSIFQSKAADKILWELYSLKGDFVIITKFNKDLISDKTLESLYRNEYKKEEKLKIRKKIRLDNLISRYNFIKFEKNLYELHKHGLDKNKILDLKCKNNHKILEKVFEKEDILVEKNSKVRFIVIGKAGKTIKILSLKNELLIIDQSNLWLKFNKLEKTEIKVSRGKGRDENSLIPGNKCQILKGKFSNLEGSVIFCSLDRCFVKFNENKKNTIEYVGIKMKDIKRINSLNNRAIFQTNIGKTVFISQGEFKGYKCKILKIYEDCIEVLVISTSKIIKISEKNIKYLESY